MKYNPLVSIIIPVYNGSNFMAEAIESALNQTYKNIEVIVVNDGSKDGGKTDAIAKSFLPRIKYIDKPNGGVGSAINEGIRQMKGEYASWLSHDDLYYPQKIERQISLLNEILEREGYFNDIIYSATEAVNVKGETILRKSCIREEVQTATIVFSNFSKFRICGCATLIPKTLFEEIGYFDEKLKTVQDTEFWCRVLFCEHKYYFQNEYLVKNRRHSEQTSRTLSDEWNKEIIDYQTIFIDKIAADTRLASSVAIWKGVGEDIIVKFPKVVRSYFINRINQLALERKDKISIRRSVYYWQVKRLCRLLAKIIYNKFIAK